VKKIGSSAVHNTVKKPSKSNQICGAPQQAAGARMHLLVFNRFAVLLERARQCFLSTKGRALLPALIRWLARQAGLKSYSN